MQKIKKMVYSIASVVALAPAMVSAQFEAPAATGLPEQSLIGIITGIMNWLLILVGVLGVIGFVIAGILYLTAAGDEGQIDKGKTAMIYSIVGVVVALLGLIIIRAAQGMLSGGNDF